MVKDVKGRLSVVGMERRAALSRISFVLEEEQLGCVL